MTIQKFQLWHRSLGVIAAIFAVVISGTGLLLNHSDNLGLDEIHVDNDWLLGLYGINPEKNTVSYREGDHWVSLVGSHIYVDDRDTGQQSDTLVGIAFLANTILVAMDDGLLLLPPEAQLTEKISVLPGVRGLIIGVGKAAGLNPVLKTQQGVYLGNEDLTAWQPLVAVPIVWSAQEILPEALFHRIMQQHRGSGISIERLVLDLHSGAILGGYGKYLGDFAAVLILSLSISGLWVLRLRRRMNLGLEEESSPEE